MATEDPFMEEMTEERQLEIALALLARVILKSDKPLAHFSRELGNAAKEIDVDVEELKKFVFRHVFPLVLGKAYGDEGRTSVNVGLER